MAPKPAVMQMSINTVAQNASFSLTMLWDLGTAASENSLQVSCSQPLAAH